MGADADSKIAFGAASTRRRALCSLVGEWLMSVPLAAGHAPIQISRKGGDRPVWTAGGYNLAFNDGTQVLLGQIRVVPSWCPARSSLGR